MRHRELEPGPVAWRFAAVGQHPRPQMLVRPGRGRRAFGVQRGDLRVGLRLAVAPARSRPNTRTAAPSSGA